MNRIKYETGLLLIIFLLLYITPIPHYQTNDDPGFQLIANGGLYEYYSANLIFPSIVFGKVLVYLYTHIGGIEWYPFIMVMLLSISICLFYTFLSNYQDFKDEPRYRLFLFLFLILIFIKMIGALQFTQISLLTASLATLIFINTNNNKIKVISIIILLCAAQIRLNSTILGAGFGFISSLVSVKKINYKHLLSILVILLFIATSFLSDLYLDEIIQQGDENAIIFKNFSLARSILDGGGGYSTSKEAINRAHQMNLSKNDWDLFSKFWYFGDYSVFDQKRIEYIAEGRAFARLEIQDFYKYLYTIINNLIGSNFLILLFIFIINFTVYKSILFRKFILNILSFLILLFIVFKIGRLPPRIFDPSLYFLLCVILFCWVNKDAKN